MSIWIFQTGEPIPSDDSSYRPMRAINLCNSLTERGSSVVLFTSSFFHQKRIHRSSCITQIVCSDKLTVVLIPSPGYKKNISIQRFFDHICLAFNLFRFLRTNTLPRPTSAFVGFPPIEFSFVAIHWLRSKSIPCILDVKDLWPQLIVESFPILLRPIARLIFTPLYLQASYCVTRSTMICSMTSSYINKLCFLYQRSPSAPSCIAPLTSPKPSFTPQPLVNLQLRQFLSTIHETHYVFSFVGSFMSVFDFSWVYRVAKILDSSSLPHSFILAGDGPFRSSVQDLMAQLPNAYFPGWLNHAEVDFVYSHTFCSLIPYKNIDNYTLNLPNKVVDSLSYGIPILTSLTGEIEFLIKNNNIGYSGCSDDPQGFIDYIYHLVDNPSYYQALSARSKSIYSNYFDPAVVYSELADQLLSLNHSTPS
jgi:glycosyltransferase involved in cell wall biosynthesis